MPLLFKTHHPQSRNCLLYDLILSIFQTNQLIKKPEKNETFEKMTFPLQIVSTSDEERATIYEMFMREIVAIVQQTRERNYHPSMTRLCEQMIMSNKRGPQKNHILVRNYILDQIGFISPGSKADV